MTFPLQPYYKNDKTFIVEIHMSLRVMCLRNYFPSRTYWSASGLNCVIQMAYNVKVYLYTLLVGEKPQHNGCNVSVSSCRVPCSLLGRGIILFIFLRCKYKHVNEVLKGTQRIFAHMQLVTFMCPVCGWVCNPPRRCRACFRHAEYLPSRSV